MEPGFGYLFTVDLLLTMTYIPETPVSGMVIRSTRWPGVKSVATVMRRRTGDKVPLTQ
jgi:hypothetical protein